MVLPSDMPIGLIDEFANDPSRQLLWRAFQKKNNLDQVPLEEIVTEVREKLRNALSDATRLATTRPKSDT